MPATLVKRDSNIGAFFPVNFAIFLRTPCLQKTSRWMLYYWGYLAGAKSDPDFAGQLLLATVSLKHCFFNCSYLISKVRILYLFSGKFLLSISIKTSSLDPFRNSFTTEFKASLFVDFVTALFTKHSR